MDSFIIIILWILFSIFIGIVAGNRKLGFLPGFILSLVLSPVIGLIIALLSEKKDWEEETAQGFTKDGMKLYNEGNYEGALQELKKALVRKGEMPDIHYKMAMCYNHTNQNDLAIKHLARAVENGFADYEKIETDPNLESLRQTERFIKFSEKGYKL